MLEIGLLALFKNTLQCIPPDNKDDSSFWSILFLVLAVSLRFISCGICSNFSNILNGVV